MFTILSAPPKNHREAFARILIQRTPFLEFIFSLVFLHFPYSYALNASPRSLITPSRSLQVFPRPIITIHLPIWSCYILPPLSPHS